MRRLAATAARCLPLLMVIPSGRLPWRISVLKAHGYGWVLDSEGVPVKIDPEITGNETSGTCSGGKDGAGAPCTYVPERRIEELYGQQGANLFSIACGSYTDVRLLRMAQTAQPLQPGPTVDPFQLALSARDRLPVLAGAIGAHPTRSLVGFRPFWYSGL